MLYSPQQPEAMPTKTDRILSYLPGTFRATPKPTAVFSFVDAFGSELQDAENSLAALMAAHWVDHADRNAEIIDDLERMAALYGLSPRPDETVEEFREHLKRYIRTFLEGTVTIQGLFRVAADTLGLRILDNYDEMDTWWDRSEDLVTLLPDRTSAAPLLFGASGVEIVGEPARSASITGAVDLSAGVDLREAGMLRVKIDDGAVIEVDLTAAAATPEAVQLVEMIAAINAAAGLDAAAAEGVYLRLSSPTSGTDSRIELVEGAGDASISVLGVQPYTYLGAGLSAAQVNGTVDASAGFDLSADRFIRIQFDLGPFYEIDCAGPDPANTTLDQVADAINSATGIAAASHDGTFLSLTSPTEGLTSVIAFQKPAAQDATNRLFGAAKTVYVGQNEAPARFTGTADLARGIDLSEAAILQFVIDGGATIVVDAAGVDPAQTSINEITAAINAEAGAALATHNGRFISLTSPTVGPASSIVFETPANDNGTPAIFGLAPRIYKGADAASAQFKGKIPLDQGINVWAQYQLAINLDGAAPVHVDLRCDAADPSQVTLDELIALINSALGEPVASHDGMYLSLASIRTGVQSRIHLPELEVKSSHPFVTRAFVRDEATFDAMGFVNREAEGTAGSHASIKGLRDLARGVDLREVRFIRLGIDGYRPFDVDCAGARPRATLLDEIMEAINTAWQAASGLVNIDIASHDGKYIQLDSNMVGAASRIAFETPQATDALSVLLGVAAGTYRGEDARRISYFSTINLSEGIVLPVNAALRMGVDGGAPVDIPFDEIKASDDEVLSLSRIVLHINAKLGVNIATHDGVRLVLTTVKRGAEAELVFEMPAGEDATPLLLGFAAPRAYTGAAATPGQVTGLQDLTGGVDLSVRYLLRLSIDGGAAVDIDCRAEAADQSAVSASEIVAAINNATGESIASEHDHHLVLTSPSTGQSSRLLVEVIESPDARSKIFGDAPISVTGEDALPAELIGEVDLSRPIDLSQRDVMRISLNDGRPVDIPVAGPTPTETEGIEVVDALNAVIPGLAQLSDENKLILTAPTAGEESRLAVMPIRAFEMREYASGPAQQLSKALHHGERFVVTNNGAAASDAEVDIYASTGVFGPALVDIQAEMQLRLHTVLRRGERARIYQDAAGRLAASIQRRDGQVEPVDRTALLAGPIGVQAVVPFEGEWHLAGTTARPSAIQLHNPATDHLVILRAHVKPGPCDTLRAAVSLSSTISESAVIHDMAYRMVGRLDHDGGAYRLVDADANILGEVRLAQDMDLEPWLGMVVQAVGQLLEGTPPVMIGARVNRLFDVTITSSDDTLTPESFEGVTIGVDDHAPESLNWRVNIGSARSALVKATSFRLADALALQRGRTEQVVMMCRVARFNDAWFNEDVFAGGICHEVGVFNASRFANAPPEAIAAVFADLTKEDPATIDVTTRWTALQPGTCELNLPLDLPEHWGGRFNHARFGLSASEPELFEDVVSEPVADPQHFANIIGATGSAFITAETVQTVPLGWSAVPLPFRKSQYLTLGNDTQGARLYVFEDDVPGYIKIEAKEAGAQGNKLFITARKSGPAQFDVAVQFDGGRFERARSVVLGDPVPALSAELMQPARVGVLQAKAGGIRIQVSRG